MVMKEEEIRKLLDKYSKGDTSLEEEQALFDNTTEEYSSIKSWSTFITNRKVEVPNNLNDDLWESFQEKVNPRNKLLPFLAVAASFTLLVSILLFASDKEDMTYAEKEARLNEAIEMLNASEVAQRKQDIIYESDMIVIYTTIE